MAAGDLNYTNKVTQSELDAAVAAGARITLTATAGNTFSAAGKLGYISAAGTVTKTDADSEAATDAAILVMSAESVAGGAAGEFLLAPSTLTTTGLTPGELWYISSTAGDITTTPPSAGGTFKRVVAKSLSATKLRFEPQERTVAN